MTRCIKLVTLLLGMFVAVACSDGGNGFVLTDGDLIGTWEGSAKGQLSDDTNDRIFMEFDGSEQTYYVRVSAEEGDSFAGSIWVGDALPYSIDGNDVSMSREGKTFIMTVNSIEDDMMYYSVKYYELDGEIIDDNTSYVARKVTEDISEDILGVWERGTSSDSFYSRYEYLSDGSYILYSYDDGSWVESTSNKGTYKLYGATLVSTWQYVDSSVVTYGTELTTVSISNDTMTWSAVKDTDGDGVSESVSSTLTRVE